MPTTLANTASPVQLIQGAPGTVVDQANPLPVAEAPVSSSSGDVAAPAANTAAVVTYAAVALQSHAISGLAWSYSGSGALAGGNLQIADGSNVVFNLDIFAKGPQSVIFPSPKIGSNGNALTITLAAGGANVLGKINVLNHWQAGFTAFNPKSFLDFSQPQDSQDIPLVL